MIYRGVFKGDLLLNELLFNGIATTKRYYSCTSKLSIAKLFWDKIILIINSRNNFDVRDISRETEVILDKDVTLEVIKVEIIEGYKYIYINEI